jgi:hypothetical protein
MSKEHEKNSVASDLFAGFIIGDRNHSFELYLVNPSDRFFWKVISLTGAFSGDESSLLETSRERARRGPLPEQFAIPLEIDDTIGGLDFVIWYELDLYETVRGQNLGPLEEMQSKPEKVSLSLPKYGLGYTTEHLPVLNREGMRIPLVPRGEDAETIDEKVKHIRMESVYHEFDN